MKSFTLKLQDAMRSEEIGGVSVFVGEDSTGSFGIRAGHARFMTILKIGLARFRVGEGAWAYLASAGAVLYFHDDTLTLSSRRYLLDEDYMRISRALQEQLLAEEETLQAMKNSLHRMEQAILRRLWEIGRLDQG